ncbi:hypothetical protein PSm6_55610 [Pseudomonas solani]|uniref:Uncharacterized protein n=1 Tax=Pseudomonas solani TaxID=2731552 RepID=A0ABM7LHQ5_9PSED|nr:hypothetical protein [Pseudomonas solani]BCD89154.1 hypothetical protein PSm6_55610 [Pseudomonas solani]
MDEQLSTIIQFAETYLGRPLTEAELQQLIAFVRSNPELQPGRLLGAAAEGSQPEDALTAFLGTL